MARTTRIITIPILVLLGVVILASTPRTITGTEIYRSAELPLVTNSNFYDLDNSADSSPYRVSPIETYFNLAPVPAARTIVYNPPEYDIPLELNDIVWDNLIRLQQRSSMGFKIDLERSGFFVPYMKQLLAEEGCPTDLVYLAMIESGFNPTVYSSAGAAGPWQFMMETGKNYGLEITEWTDERLDVEKSTRAAAKHLQDLFGMFQKWPLVLAAYNAGPGAVQKAIARRNTDDFWKLIEYDEFKGETKAFVPRFYASMIIGKHPERYGFTNMEPMQSASPVCIKAPPLTDLATVADVSGAPYEQLVQLNANYTFGSTPPDPGPWTIRVPQIYADGLQKKINALGPDQRNKFHRHKVRRNESLFSIARKYGVPSIIIKQANYMHTMSVKRDQVLVIPNISRPVPNAPEPEPELVTTPSGVYVVKYTVGEGDTLWKIANKAGVEIADLCRWNKIKTDDYIHPGQDLVIFCEETETARSLTIEANKNRNKALTGPQTQRVVFHTVTAGDNLSKIAKKYGVSVKDIIGWNGLKDPYIIKPGEKLKILQ